MFSDSGLEFAPEWFVAPWNPGIGPVQPIAATVTPASNTDPNMQVLLDAPPGYSNMLAAIHRPLGPVEDPSKVYYSFDFTMIPDAQSPKLQAFEFEALYYFTDTKGVGHVLRNQMQYSIVNPIHELQMWTPSNPWTNTGIIVPMFKPGVPWPVRVNYIADTVGLTMSTTSVTIAGINYPLPAPFQKVPGQILNPPWQQGCYVQFQPDGPAGGVNTVLEFNNVAVNWE